MSVAVLVASSTPLDQFIVNHPEYFLSQPPEMGLINPDNIHILINHLQCATFELPFGVDETFGGHDVSEILEFLRDREGNVHWLARGSERRLYSRSGDDIGAAFPDICAAMPADVTLDGELLVIRDGEVAPFNDLQQRLNRKTVTPKMLKEHPAHVRLYDVLSLEGEDPVLGSRCRIGVGDLGEEDVVARYRPLVLADHPQALPPGGRRKPGPDALGLTDLVDVLCEAQPRGLAHVGAVCGPHAVAADHRPHQTGEVVDQFRPRCVVTAGRRCDQSCHRFRFVGLHEDNISNWTTERIGGTPYFACLALPSSAPRGTVAAPGSGPCACPGASGKLDA